MGKREQNKAEKRAAILKAAWHFFVDLGYENTSVVLIVEEAGIARGTFYQYYTDKDELFDELLISLYQPLVQILEEALQDITIHKSDREAQQKRSLRTAILLAQHLESRKAHWPLHFRAVWGAGYAGAAVRQWRQRIEALSILLLSTAQQHHLFRPINPTLVALSFVGATERLIWAWLNDELELSRREMAQQLAALFWQGLTVYQPVQP